MATKEVWEETTLEELNAKLGYIPEVLPAKLVNTMKPPEIESEKELGFKARSRVVGCGNFQNTSDATKEEFASCNVDPEVVRFMLAMLASNPTWTALSWDVVCAFF